MRPPEIERWRLIVPVKGQLTAKSRLHPPAGVARADLAHAFALDTITAAFAGVSPGQVIVVTSDEHTATFVRERGGVVLADQGQGLNPAIRLGIRYVEQALGPGPGAVLLGDIPTLRPQDLVNALAACSEHRRALVPDASGQGTVLLSALSVRDLHPLFGPDSARKHSRHSTRLDLDLPALRTDVDDDQALRAAVTIGVGWHTAVVLRPAPGYRGPMQASVHRYHIENGSGSVLLDDGREIPFDVTVMDASGLRMLRPGQRVSIEMTATELTRLWIVGIGEGELIR
ncbi:MAG TPA: 2-phospho-L-lactate guanylyltransferase [Dermatophilaceae bacterium]